MTWRVRSGGSGLAVACRLGLLACSTDGGTTQGADNEGAATLPADTAPADVAADPGPVPLDPPAEPGLETVDAPAEPGPAEAAAEADTDSDEVAANVDPACPGVVARDVTAISELFALQAAVATLRSIRHKEALGLVFREAACPETSGVVPPGVPKLTPGGAWVPPFGTATFTGGCATETRHAFAGALSSTYTVATACDGLRSEVIWTADDWQVHALEGAPYALAMDGAWKALSVIDPIEGGVSKQEDPFEGTLKWVGASGGAELVLEAFPHGVTGIYRFQKEVYDEPSPGLPDRVEGHAFQADFYVACGPRVVLDMWTRIRSHSPDPLCNQPWFDTGSYADVGAPAGTRGRPRPGRGAPLVPCARAPASTSARAACNQGGGFIVDRGGRRGQAPSRLDCARALRPGSSVVCTFGRRQQRAGERRAQRRSR